MTMQNVYGIKRNRKGEVVQIMHKGKKWSVLEIKQKIINGEEEILRRALKIVLENEMAPKSCLFEELNVGGFQKDDWMKGVAQLLLATPDWNQDIRNALARELPKYADQVWDRLLSNLNIKKVAKTYSTPRNYR